MQSYPLKFILVGDSSVGKSQLSRRFTKKSLNSEIKSTVGIEFSTREIEFEKCQIKAQIWDTAGQEQYESLTKAYYRDSVGAMLVYDISNRASFEHIKSGWLKQVREYGHEKMSLILVGNKLDLIDSVSPDRIVSHQEAIQFAEAHQIDFIEISAQSGLGVEEAFRRLCLGVARLLPPVAIHLDLTGLPEGWMRTTEYRGGVGGGGAEEGPAITPDKEKEKDKGSTSRNRKKVIPESLPSPPPSIGAYTLYINYWTGESQTEPPTQPAPSTLLYTARPRTREKAHDPSLSLSSLTAPPHLSQSATPTSPPSPSPTPSPTPSPSQSPLNPPSISSPPSTSPSSTSPPTKTQKCFCSIC